MCGKSESRQTGIEPVAMETAFLISTCSNFNAITEFEKTRVFHWKWKHRKDLKTPHHYRWHMTRCLMLYVIRELQFKTTVRYHSTPIRMAKIQKTESTKCWQGCGAAGTYSLLRRMQIAIKNNPTNWMYSYHILQQLYSLFLTQTSWKLSSI